ncbi:MAG TPA: PAS domain S-box protein [Segetibacter sp.]|jgi:PAS domain S-box-containing protein
MGANLQDNSTSALADIRKLAFDYSPDSILIINPRLMKFVDANQTALKSLGYSKDELIGLTVEDIDASFTNETMAAAFENIINSKEQHATIPTRHRRKDKTTFDVEVYLRCFKDDGHIFILATSTQASVLLRVQNELNFHSALFNKISDAIISTDENFVITSWNRYAEEMFGWTEEEAIGKPTRDLTAAIYPNQTSEEVTQFVRDNGHWKGEIFAHRKDGNVIPVMLSVGVIMDSANNVTGYVSVVRDISERHKLETELRSLNESLEKRVIEKTEELTNVFDRISDGVVAYDRDWKYTYVNKKASEITGKQPEEMLGKKIWEIFPDLVGTQLYENYHHAMSKQQSIRLVFFNPLFKRWFEGSLHPSDQGMSVYFHDITERKLAEIAIEKSEERYRKAQALGKLGHWLRDVKTQKLTWSEEIYKIFEVDPGLELDYQTFMSYVHQEDKAVVQEFQELALAGLKPYKYYHRIILKDGTTKHLHVVADVGRDEQGTPIYISGMVQDVTEQKLVEEKLKESRLQLSIILNNIVDSVSLFKVEGPNRFRYLAVNDAYTKTTKIKREHAIGKLFGELVPSIHFNQLFQVLNKAINTCDIQKFESIYNWFEGEKAFQITAVPIKNDTGISDKILVIAKDITERKLSEQRLIKSEENNRVLFEQTPVPIWMLNKDLDFIKVNQAAISEYGYTKEEFLSMNLMQIKLPEDHPSLHDVISNPDGSPGYTRITRHVLKNGEIIYSKVHSTTFNLDSQEVVLVVSKNITSEILAQKDLIENEQQLSLIFDSTKDAMWLLNVEDQNNYRVETYNKAYETITGIEKQKAVGMLVQDVLPPENFDKIRSKYKQVIETGAVLTYYMTMSFPTGEVTAEVTLTPIKDHKGKVVRVLGTGVDVSQQQKARKELIKMNLELRQLASHLQNVREEERTHIAREIHDELGQQLTGLKMDLAWLKKKISCDEDGVAVRINSALQLVDGTINTVRKIASELRPSIIDDLGITEALDWHCQEFTKRTAINVQFVASVNEMKLPGEIPIAVFRIVQEALTNVARHSNATEVICTLKEINNELLLSVFDNGKGFSLTHQERKTLGLLGMRERVAILNGEYTIRSEPGEGTTISVKIPLTF